MGILAIAAPRSISGPAESGRAEHPIGFDLPAIEMAFDVLLDLPCAMLIVSKDGIVQMANREAQRLLSSIGADPMGKAIFPAGAPLGWLNGAEGEAADISLVFPSSTLQSIELPARLSEWMPNGPESARGLFAVALGTPPPPKEPVRVMPDPDLSILFQVIPSMVHELRNPLAVIAVTAELLAEDATTERMKESLRDILNETQRMKFSLNRMASLNRPAKRFKFLPLSSSLHELASFFEWLSNSKQVEFSTDIEAGLEAPFEPQALCVLIHNLLLNAFQACGDGNHIQLSARLEAGAENQGQMLRIEVRDDGIGMDENTLLRCREALFSMRRNGAGLGLYVCEEMVKEAGGQMLIHSALGQGTRVEVQLPISAHVKEDSAKSLAAIR